MDEAGQAFKWTHFRVTSVERVVNKECPTYAIGLHSAEYDDVLTVPWWLCTLPEIGEAVSIKSDGKYLAILTVGEKVVISEDD